MNCFVIALKLHKELNRSTVPIEREAFIPRAVLRISGNERLIIGNECLFREYNKRVLTNARNEFIQAMEQEVYIKVCEISKI